MEDIKQLCDTVRQIGYSIHVYLGPGHLEKVYENALVHRLRKAGIAVEQQVPINVYDVDGTLIGEFIADIIIDGRLIVELKAVKTMVNRHVAQILGYLRATNINDGLLINFGAEKYQIKKYRA